ncbi:MAG: hypothetical protein AAGF73_11230 [Actinomycetota bacterium]
MDELPDGYVSIQIHMSPQVLAELRSAAHRAGLPFDVWLTQILARGVRRSLNRRLV